MAKDVEKLRLAVGVENSVSRNECDKVDLEGNQNTEYERKHEGKHGG